MNGRSCRSRIANGPSRFDGKNSRAHPNFVLEADAMVSGESKTEIPPFFIYIQECSRKVP